MFTRPLFQARSLSARGFSTGLFFAVATTVLLSQEAQADPINWRNNLDSAMVEANRTGKLVLLHFYTASCGPCKKLERDVFSQPQIAAAMEKDFVPVKLNADDAPAYANQYQITRVPSEVVLTPQGNVVQKQNSRALWSPIPMARNWKMSLSITPSAQSIVPRLPKLRCTPLMQA